MASGFAAGLAQGLQNGLEMYSAYQGIQEKKKKAEIMDKIAAAAAGDDADQGVGLKDVVVSDQAMRDIQGRQSEPVAAGSGAQAYPAQASEPTMMQPQAAGGAPDGGAAQAFPVAPPSEPTMGPTSGVGMPQDASGQAAGLQGAPAPGLAMIAQQDRQADALGLGKKKDNQAPQAFPGGGEHGFLGGGEFGNLSERLTRGMRKAIELGAFDQAINLMTLREKAIGQYRDQALGEAMSRFDLTGDANAFVPFVNRFMPTSIKFDSVQPQGQTADGQPVYVARGTNTETGQPFEHAFSRQSLMQYVTKAGDGAAYRTMFVEQAQHLYKMQEFKEQERFKTDEGIRKAGAVHGMTLSEIGARGAEQRKTDAAKGTVDSKTAAPSEVRTAQWLISNGVAKDPKDAWEMVRGAKTKSANDFALEYARSVLAGQRNNPLDKNNLTPEQAVQQGRELYRSMNQTADDTGAQSTGQGPTTGAVVDGYRFKGGNPNDQGNWEAM